MRRNRIRPGVRPAAWILSIGLMLPLSAAEPTAGIAGEGVPRRTVREFHDQAKSLGDGFRLRLQGVVTLPSDGSFFLQEGDAGVKIYSPGTNVVHVGDRVVAEGIVSLGRSMPMLRDATNWVEGTGGVVQPALITQAQAMSGYHSMALVRMRGYLSAEHGVGDWLLLVKPDGDEKPFAVDLAMLDDMGPIAELKPGSDLEVTGILSRRHNAKGEPVGVQLTVRTHADVGLIAGPPFLTAHRTRQILGLVSLGALALLAWVAALRNRVSAQTRIIERRLREEADLRASEDRFAKFFRASPDPILIVNVRDERIQDLNPAFEQLTGYSRAEVCGRTTLELDLWADPVRRREAAELLQREGSVINHEVEVRTRSGKVLLCLGSAERIEVNGAQCLMAVIRDITERKQTETALRQSEEALRRAQSIAHMGNWTFDVATGVFIGSDESRRIFGWDAVPRTVRDLEAVIPEEDLARVEAAWAATLAGAAFDVEHRVVVSGIQRWLHSKGEPERDASKRVVRILGVTHDITERKQAEVALQENEALFRAIAEQTPDGMYLLDIGDPDVPGLILYANGTAARMHGLSLEETVGRSIAELEASENLAELRDRIRRLRAGETLRFYVNHRRRDGVVFPVEAVARPVQALGGSVVLAIDRDITERLQAEQALSASEQRYRQAFEINTAIKLIIDSETGRILDANTAACRYYGYARDELLALRIADLNWVPPDGVSPDLTAAVSTGLEYAQFRHRLASGDIRDVEIYSGPLATGGRPLLYSIIHDITERKQAEALALGQKDVLEMIARQEPPSRTLDTLLRTIEAQAPEMICSVLLLDEDGVHLRHGAAPRLPAEYTRQIDGAAIGPRAGSCGTAAFTGRSVYVEDVESDPLWADYRQLARPHGLRACWSTPIFNAQKRVLGTFAVYYQRPQLPNERQIRLIELGVHTAAICLSRHRAEEELRHSRERFSELVSSVGGIVWEADPRTLQFLFVNQAAERILGHRTEAWLEHDFWVNHLHAEDRERVVSYCSRYTRQGLNHDLEYRMIAADGRHVWLRDLVTVVSNDAGPVRLRGLMIDITDRKHADEERRQLQARLQQAEKMESLGTLAGGIAHDFNNILGAIIGNIDLLKLDLGEGHAAQQYVSEIRKAGLRARDLVKQILAFSREQPRELRILSLQQIVEETVRLLRSAVPPQLQIELRIGADCPPVLADAAQMHQVAMNLATNAWQAMERRAGAVTFALRPVRISAGSPIPQPELRPGLYVQFQVSDQGVGMDSSVRERIFDPFFTTKGVGKGTGLGLAIVHGIVRNHGGAIVVHSVPGEGSTFEVYLPAADGVPDGTTPSTRDGGTPRGRGQSILLVDDEEPLVLLAQRSLERLGYHVTGFTHAFEALEFFRDDPAQFHLVVTDLNMPGISGLQVIQEVRKVRPDIPIVLSSGYVTDDLRASALQCGANEVFYKPGTMRELAEMLDRVFAG